MSFWTGKDSEGILQPAVVLTGSIGIFTVPELLSSVDRDWSLGVLYLTS
jgi:hypothetical protein